MPYDPNQPRDPKGTSTGGQWSARKGAGLGKAYTPIISSQLEWEASVGRISLVAQYGEPCPINSERSLNAGYSLDTKKTCYKNAFQLVESNPEYTYVEGLAVPQFIGMPFEHAWAVDAQGFVVDTTWEDGVEYFGIPFHTDFVRKIILETQQWGVLNWSSKTMRQIYAENKFPKEAVKKLP
jgi:hypothetical protein